MTTKAQSFTVNADRITVMAIPKIRTKRIGLFHILGDKHTLVAGFKVDQIK
jgi:hypothetical protein